MKPILQEDFDLSRKTKQKKEEPKMNSLLSDFIPSIKNNKQLSFKSVINDIRKVEQPPNFKKKVMKTNPINQMVNLKVLQEQNERLHKQLQDQSKCTDQLNQYEKNILKLQKQKCQEKIEQLEQEIQQLARDNYKLKQVERSNKNYSQFNDSLADKDSQSYIPYVMETKNNDLNKIKLKNKPQNKQYQEPYSSEFPDYHNNQKIQKYIEPLNMPLTLEPIKHVVNNTRHKNLEDLNLEQVLNATQYSTDSISQFQSFQMVKNMNNQPSFQNSREQLMMDSKTSTRNKVAFFKKSLVIIRNNEFEVAFKKSDLNSSLTSGRVIFYVQNKTNRNMPVNFQYEYEKEYFEIQIQQKLRNVAPGSQGRQVSFIILKNKNDLNSVIDVQFIFGDKKYQLWLPICFINFTSSPQPINPRFEQTELIIEADRQFTSYENVSNILPCLQKIGKYGDKAIVYGISKFGSGIINLQWNGNEITIQAPEIWNDFLGFVFHHYK